jgi:hypothetical protein
VAFKVNIGGTDIPVFPKDISWNDRIGAIPTANIVIKVATGEALAQRGQEAYLYDSVLTEVINKTQADVNPPGLVYEGDPQHIGYFEAFVPAQAHATGTFETILALLYQLPDISEYVSADYPVRLVLMGNGPYYSDWVGLGAVWVHAEQAWYWYAKLTTHTGETFFEKEYISTTPCDLSTSHRLSLSWSSGTAIFYIDGVAESTQEYSGTAEGYYFDPNPIFFQGNEGYTMLGGAIYFADVRSWLDVRTPEEILATAKTRLTGDDLIDANLEGYWMCDEMTGTVVADSGPVGSDGDLIMDVATETYLLWDYAPDGWLPGGGPTCIPDTVPYRYFGGFISSVGVETEGVDVVKQNIKIEGYATLLNRYKGGINFLNPHPGKYFAQYLAENKLDAWAIGYACMPEGSQTISVSDWTNKFLKACLDEVKTSTDWIWYIDPYRELRYHPRGYKAAPFNITASDSPAHYQPNSLSISQDKAGYYNKLYARVRYTDETDVERTVNIVITNATEIAARMAAEGGDGVYEHYEDLPNANSPELGLDQAYGMLMAASTLGKTVDYTTRTPGMRAGMTQTITLPDLGLSGSFLIEQVSTRYSNGYLFYDVSATSWKLPKIEPLTELLSTSIASKTNWREDALIDGIATVIDLSSGAMITLYFSEEHGDIADISKWDTGLWNFTEWS